MKFYIPFGDWSRDGHGMYENVLVEAESMDKLCEAVDKIKEKYGKNFFDYFAEECCSSSISITILNALTETNYSLEDFLKTDKYNTVFEEDEKEVQKREIKSFRDFARFKGWIFENDSEMDTIDFSRETIEHMYIHLLNAFGAGITILKDYPCFTYQTVGYGCFS